MIKKSKLLSLLTAASIVLTSAGTYAAWDTLKDDTTAEVTFRNPVTVEVGQTSTLSTGDGELDAIQTASGDITFTVSGNEKKLAKNLTLEVGITGGTGATLSDFNIEIRDKNDTTENNRKLSASGDNSNQFTDNSIESTVYTVNVTPKDGTQARTAGVPVNISLTATLSK